MRTLPLGLVVLVASVAATGAMIAFGYAAGAAPWGLNIFRTPIPYALLFLCWFVITPAYLLLRGWVRLRLSRFLAVSAGLSVVLFVYHGLRWEWHRAFMQPRPLLWMIGFPLVGALTYWATLRRLAPELDER